MIPVVEQGWRSERRGRLLQAAARVFSRSEYELASMDEIAREAGVGKPTLYRYFPGKDALHAAVFVDALDRLELRLASVLDRESGIEAQLRGLVSAIVPTFRDHLVSPRLVGDGSAAIDQSRRRIFRERRSRIAGFLVRAIEAGAARGDVRWSVEADRVAHLMIGMIWAGTATSRAGDRDVTDDIVGLVLDGIAERNGPERSDWNGAKNGRPAETTPAAGSHRRDEATLP